MTTAGVDAVIVRGKYTVKSGTSLSSEPSAPGAAPVQRRITCPSPSWGDGCADASAATSTNPTNPTNLFEFIMNDSAVHDREHRLQLLDSLVGYLRRIEVIAAQDRQVAELADFDRAELVLLAQEPAVVCRVQTQCFHPVDCLVAVDGDA